jgi:DNA-binding transcriptional MerR regulator
VDFASERKVESVQKPQEVVLTTAMVGREVGYSTQQVRDLEHMDVIPPAARGSNGYRRYDVSHVIALHAYRALAAAINPVRARRLMPVLLRSSIDEAAECMDDIHAEIARDRTRVREALRGLDAVMAEDDDAFDESDTMTIGELAEALGVRTSALRHWEAEGLIVPDRVDSSRARRYRTRAITEARIVAALRAGGYPLPPISRVLALLRMHGLTAEARALLHQRLSDLTRRSIALLDGAGRLHTLLASRPSSG